MIAISAIKTLHNLPQKVQSRRLTVGFNASKMLSMVKPGVLRWVIRKPAPCEAESEFSLKTDASEAAKRNLRFPVDLKPIDADPIEAEIRTRRFGHLWAIEMESRLGFRAVSDDWTDAYIVNFPLRGSTVRCCNSREFENRVGMGSLYHLRQLEWIDVSPRYRTVGLMIDAPFLHRQHELLTGEAVDGTIPFAPVIDTRPPGLEALRRSVVMYHDAARDERGEALIEPLLQELFAQQLLTLWPRSADPGPRSDASTPRTLSRARDFIMAGLDSSLTVAAVAEAAGVSVRALQMAFRKELGITPVSFILRERLERAHTEIRAAGPKRAISQIAYDNGFLHMSDFSRRYRERFGETPSQTRRRR